MANLHFFLLVSPISFLMASSRDQMLSGLCKGSHLRTPAPFVCCRKTATSFHLSRLISLICPRSHIFSAEKLGYYAPVYLSLDQLGEQFFSCVCNICAAVNLTVSF